MSGLGEQTSHEAQKPSSDVCCESDMIINCVVCFRMHVIQIQSIYCHKHELTVQSFASKDLKFIPCHTFQTHHALPGCSFAQLVIH